MTIKLLVYHLCTSCVLFTDHLPISWKYHLPITCHVQLEVARFEEFFPSGLAGWQSPKVFKSCIVIVVVARVCGSTPRFFFKTFFNQLFNT